MLANLLDSLDLPPASRIAVQVEKSVESLLFYLAVLRAGHVYLPLNTAYKSDEIGYFIGDAEPAVFVCAPKDFVWASKLAFAAGTTFVFTLGDDRSGSCSNARPTSATATRRRCARATTSRRSCTRAAPPGAARARC